MDQNCSASIAFATSGIVHGERAHPSYLELLAPLNNFAAELYVQIIGHVLALQNLGKYIGTRLLLS